MRYFCEKLLNKGCNSMRMHRKGEILDIYETNCSQKADLDQ
jgi:hypothetical protein